MLIICPYCSAEHEVPDDFSGPSGRKVRCRGCREVWQAMPSIPEQEHDALPLQADAPPEPAAVEVLPPEAPARTAPAPRAPRRPTRARGAAGLRKAPATTGRPAMLRAGVIAGAVLVVVALLVALRAPIVRAAPQTARLYAALSIPVNLRGLDLGAFTSHLYTENGARLLVVEGAITNVTRQPRPVPALRFAVRDAKGAELYVWSAKPDKTEIAAGETLSFRKRLAAPPNEGRNVEVRFLDEGEHAEALTAREGGKPPQS
jgi:predicted Zn finger-like uncharacterized protein